MKDQHSEASFAAYLASIRDLDGGSVENGAIRLFKQPDEIAAVRTALEQQLAKRGMPLDGAEIGWVYQDPYIVVARDAVQFPNGRIGSYLRILAGKGDSAGVCIVPVFERRLVLLRQFRHPTRRWHYEFPRGASEGDSDGVVEARRELLEEISVAPITIELLGRFYPDTGLLGKAVLAYIARVPRPPAIGGDDGTAAIKTFALREFLRLVAAGEVDDGMTLCALSLLLSSPAGEELLTAES